MVDAQLRFAAANLADIKNRMSAPATPLIRYNGSMKKVSAKRKLRQFTVVIEQDEDGYYVGGLAQTPWFGVCDVLKGHSSVGSSIQRVHTQD